MLPAAGWTVAGAVSTGSGGATVSTVTFKVFDSAPADGWQATPIAHDGSHPQSLTMSAGDRAILAGEQGRAAALRLAALGATVGVNDLKAEFVEATCAAIAAAKADGAAFEAEETKKRK